MKKYKLTDQNMQTHDNCQWQLNEAKETDGNSNKLCNSHWLHYYNNPLLAVLLNPIHANIRNPRLFEVKALGKHLKNDELKGGCTKLILIKELILPEITLNQKVAFAILCSLEVCKKKEYIEWAKNWLNSKDRTRAAAVDAATYTAYDAAYAAATYAAAAVDAATYTAYDAAYAAYTADAAAYAATNYTLDLIKLAKQAMKYK